MKNKVVWAMTLWVAGLSAGAAIVGCTKETPPSPAEQAAAERAEAAKLAADKAAAQRVAADKAAAEKVAAQKAVAAKVAADEAAATEAAARADAEAAALPGDLVETKAEVARTMAQLDLTMAKLEALAASTGDLDDPSEDAIDAIDLLEVEAQAVRARADEMRDRGAAYFEVWEKQLASMSTPEVVEIATKRKDELSAKYAEVLTAMQESRAAFDAYWAEMGPIREAVDDGLDQEKQKAFATQVKSAKGKAATLKDRIDATLAKLDQVSLVYMNR